MFIMHHEIVFETLEAFWDWSRLHERRDRQAGTPVKLHAVSIKFWESTSLKWPHLEGKI